MPCPLGYLRLQTTYRPSPHVAQLQVLYLLHSNLASDGAQTSSSLCFSHIMVIIMSNLLSDWTFHNFNKVFAPILSVVESLMSHMHTLPNPAEVIS